MKCNIGSTIINYDIKGSGKPILLFSGFANDMTTMKNCMEPIFEKKGGWKRIYVDHLGVGDTLIGENVKEPIDVLNVMTSFVENIIGNERFTLAGYSFGGFVSRYILNKKFNMVDGLMLFNPLITLDLKKADIDWNVQKIKENDEELASKIENRMVTDINGAMTKTNFEFLNMLQDKMLQNKNNELIEFDTFTTPFEKPTLILTGKQDAVVGYKDAFRLLDKYPRATYCVLDKSGHAAQIEQSVLFNSLVEEWLYRVDEIISHSLVVG